MLHRVRTACKAALLSGLLVVAGLPAGGPAAAATETPEAADANALASGGISAWLPSYMYPSTPAISATQALFDATHYSVIIAQPGRYNSYAAAMRRANPNLQLLAYLNGVFAFPGEPPHPENWYLHDAHGARVKSKYGNSMMDVSNPGWIADRQQLCVSEIASTGYVGCSLDTLGIAPILPGYCTALAVNPATGKPFTESEWLHETSALAAAVRAYAAPRPVWGNGIGDGQRYWDPVAPTGQLLNGLDGAMVELFLRLPTSSLNSWPALSDWLDTVHMLQDVSARGKRMVVVTKGWANGTIAQKDAWELFSMATFLLGDTNGTSSWSFLFQYRPAYPIYQRWWGAAIGTPTGTFTQNGSAYGRTFSGGLVLVNPNGGSVTVHLTDTYQSIQGKACSGSITLGPHSGEVLLDAGSNSSRAAAAY